VFGIAPSDSDGVLMSSYNLDTDSPANGNDRTTLATVPLRFGRLRLQNAIGSHLLALPVPMETQYWTTNGFITNTDDSCTSITAANIGLGRATSGIALAATTASVPAGSFVAGRKTLTLSKPSATGAVDLVVNLGSTTTVDSNNTCLSWVTTPAPTGANLAYLRGKWCGANADRYPTARATFGLYKGPDHFIYQRENY
jgi:MSHA biogenesis protein MshQ